MQKEGKNDKKVDIMAKRKLKSLLKIEELLVQFTLDSNYI